MTPSPTSKVEFPALPFINPLPPSLLEGPGTEHAQNPALEDVSEGYTAENFSLRRLPSFSDYREDMMTFSSLPTSHFTLRPSSSEVDEMGESPTHPHHHDNQSVFSPEAWSWSNKFSGNALAAAERALWLKKHQLELSSSSENINNPLPSFSSSASPVPSNYGSNSFFSQQHHSNGSSSSSSSSSNGRQHVAGNMQQHQQQVPVDQEGRHGELGGGGGCHGNAEEARSRASLSVTNSKTIVLTNSPASSWHDSKKREAATAAAAAAMVAEKMLGQQNHKLASMAAPPPRGSGGAHHRKTTATAQSSSEEQQRDGSASEKTAAAKSLKSQEKVPTSTADSKLSNGATHSLKPASSTVGEEGPRKTSRLEEDRASLESEKRGVALEGVNGGANDRKKTPSAEETRLKANPKKQNQVDTGTAAAAPSPSTANPADPKSADVSGAPSSADTRPSSSSQQSSSSTEQPPKVDTPTEGRGQKPSEEAAAAAVDVWTMKGPGRGLLALSVRPAKKHGIAKELTAAATMAVKKRKNDVLTGASLESARFITAQFTALAAKKEEEESATGGSASSAETLPLLGGILVRGDAATATPPIVGGGTTTPATARSGSNTPTILGPASSIAITELPSQQKLVGGAAAAAAAMATATGLTGGTACSKLGSDLSLATTAKGLSSLQKLQQENKLGSNQVTTPLESTKRTTNSISDGHAAVGGVVGHVTLAQSTVGGGGGGGVAHHHQTASTGTNGTNFQELFSSTKRKLSENTEKGLKQALAGYVILGGVLIRGVPSST